MGKWKEKRQAKKEAKAQKKAQKQANKQAKKDAKIAKKNAKTEIKLSRANKNNAKAEGIRNGTYQPETVGSVLGGALNTVGSIFGGGGAEETYEETNEYVPESVASGQTPFTPVGNPTVQQSESKNKTGLYVGIGGGILALILLIVGLKK